MGRERHARVPGRWADTGSECESPAAEERMTALEQQLLNTLYTVSDYFAGRQSNGEVVRKIVKAALRRAEERTGE